MARLNSFDEYEEKSTINFPSPLDDDQSRNLLSHIKNRGNYHRIRCDVGASEIFEGSEFEERKYKRSGEINILKHPLFVNFEFFRNHGEENENKYNGIKFSSFGLNPNQIPELEIEVWDQVRTYTQSYFELREQEKAFNQR